MERQQDDGIWIIDADAKSAYANERMGEIRSTSRNDNRQGMFFYTARFGHYNHRVSEMTVVRRSF
jgi:hypothetical protein